VAVTKCLAQDAKEKAVQAYYSGFETHNWDLVAAQFADNFTFTSPNNDDHIPLATFRERCWPTNKFFKKVNLIKTAESGNNLFLLVEIMTTDGKTVRNTDFYTFNDAGKIESIECFFGPGVSFPGNKK
jgi:hypothetical protein